MWLAVCVRGGWREGLRGRPDGIHSSRSITSSEATVPLSGFSTQGASAGTELAGVSVLAAAGGTRAAAMLGSCVACASDDSARVADVRGGQRSGEGGRATAEDSTTCAPRRLWVGSSRGEATVEGKIGQQRKQRRISVDIFRRRRLDRMTAELVATTDTSLAWLDRMRRKTCDDLSQPGVTSNASTW